MSHLHKINFPQLHISENVSFFADFWSFLSRNIGRIDAIHLNTPLSLCEHILYQIENNFEHCPRYIISSWSHPLLQLNSENLECFDGFGKLREHCTQLLGLKLSKAKKYINENNVADDVRTLIHNLDRDMLPQSINRIIELLEVQQSSESEREELMYHTNLVFAHTIFNGRYLTTMEYFWMSFFTNEKNINLNSISKELRALTSEESKELIFIFSLDGISLDKKTELIYNEVKFYSSTHSIFTQIRQHAQDSAISQKIFDDKKVLAVVNVKCVDFRSGSMDAIKKIHKEIVYLNNQLEGEIYLNRKLYLFAKDLSSSIGYSHLRGKNFELTEFERDIINDSPYVRVKDSSLDFRNNFLKYESLYEYSIWSNQAHEQYRYLEVLLKPIESKSNLDLSEVFSLILLTDHKTYTEEKYYKNVINSINNDRSGTTGLREEFREFYFKHSNSEIPYDEIPYPTKNGFINYQLSKISSLKSTPNFKAAKEYYLRIFYDLKAERNALAHDGSEIKNSAKTVQIVIPPILIRLRNILINRAIGNNKFSFVDVVNSLVDEANNTLND